MPTLSDDALHDADDWIASLQHTLDTADPPRVVFVVGAALSYGPDPSGTKCGVWNVARVVEEIGKLDASLQPNTPESPAAHYQRLLGKLAARTSRRTVEDLVRGAVLAASTAPDGDKASVFRGSNDERRAVCERLQKRGDAWLLPNGTRALAAVLECLLKRVGQQAAKAPCVVTTNFDGLLEVALDRRGVEFVSRGSAADEYRRPESNQVEILHVHGYWCDEPTMHTPEALTAPRPKLRDALRDRFDGAKVYVLGYGGWEDILCRTLGEASGAIANLPEVMWAFHASKEGVQQALKFEDSEQRRVVERFNSALGRCSVSYYVGVDAHSALQKVGCGSAPPPPDSEPSGPGGLREALDQLIRQGLERLLKVTPEGEQRRLQTLVDQQGPVDLCSALGAVCRTMEKLVGTQHATFALAAHDEVFEWAGKAGTELPPLALGSGRVHGVPIKTATFAEILMARAQGEQPRLRFDTRDAVGEDALFIEATFQQGRQKEPDVGRDEGDWVRAVEEYVWDQLRPNETYDRDKLHGMLQARGDLMRRIYALIEPGAVPDQWTPVAKGLPSVEFIQLGADGEVVLPADEHRIAELLAAFVSLEGGRERVER